MTDLTPDAVRAMRARAELWIDRDWRDICYSWLAQHAEIERLKDFLTMTRKSLGKYQIVANAMSDITRLEIEERNLRERLAASFERELALTADRDDLRRWKDEHLIVTADLQAIGKLIGVGLGQYVHDKIEPFLREIISERDDLRRRLEAAERGDTDELAQRSYEAMMNDRRDGDKPTASV